jgi:DNA polymerase III subunit chi
MTKAQENMSKTTIYFVETRTEEQSMAVCQVVDHFYEQGRRVHVVAGSSVAAQRLDQLLWTFAQASFIPHRIGLPGQTGAVVEPVIITVEAIPVAGAAVLVCDGLVGLEFMERYQDVVHFVLMDDSEKRQESRSLWQSARDRGLQATHVAYNAKGKAFSALPQ